VTKGYENRILKDEKDKPLEEGNNIKYTWITNNPDACDKCKELDGKEFFNKIENIPQRPHPNCKCTVKQEQNKKGGSYSLSSDGIDLIIEFEGSVEAQTGESFINGRFYPYYCEAGKYTIGYGHVIKTGEKFDEQNGISKVEAEQLIKQDCEVAVEDINHLISNPNLTQEQQDSLISLLFNIGVGGSSDKNSISFYDSETRRMINLGVAISGEGKTLKEHWSEWRKTSDGKISQGLSNRRAKEWDYGNWDSFGPKYG